MARLSTHVLDTASGQPAKGMRIDFCAVEDDGSTRLIRTVHTNADGRTDEPLLAGATIVTGRYQLTFFVGAYFAGIGVAAADPPFLDRVPICFGVADAAGHYHVPLLVSPWSYATYRGS